jgi:hypothetical protein
MNNRAKLIATLGASGFAGVLIVTLALGADTRIKVHPTQHKTDAAAPLCSSGSDIAEPTFYSEMTKANMRMHRDMEIAASGDVDRDFARMMIPHHQGAIDMAVVQLKYGHDERLRRLAQSIIVEQKQEIDYMRSLLDRPPAQLSQSIPPQTREMFSEMPSAEMPR